LKFEIDDTTGMIISPDPLEAQGVKYNANNTSLEQILQAVKKTQEKLVNQNIQDSKRFDGLEFPFSFPKDSKEYKAIEVRHKLEASKKYIEPVVMKIDRKVVENQKIRGRLKTEWQNCVNQIKLLEMMLGSKYDPHMTQQEFNTKAAHYLDQKGILETIYLSATGKDIKELS